MRSFPVIVGTVRQGNATEPVARFATERIGAREDASARLYKPGALPFANLKQRIDRMEEPPEAAERFRQALAQADGFVFVTPEYNHGYPGALKNVIDHFYDEWAQKPFALVTTGGSSGGLRAAEQLRLVVTGGLGGVVVPREITVPRVGDVFGSQGPLEEVEAWTRRFDRMAEQLVAYAAGMDEVRRLLSDS